MNQAITEAVNALPEKYQMIYGHPELSEGVSRACSDRGRYICQIVNDLQLYTNRKRLKVLDLGCAQGFYSLALAEMDCEVYGIDSLEKNIEVCKLLKEENNFENCSFTVNELSLDYANKMMEEYDVILTLSVMHHIAFKNGFEKAREIFEILAAHTKIMISEMAVKTEPLYWNQTLPSVYDEWYSTIRFFDEVSFFNTHLSEIQRPLIISSNKLLYLNRKFYQIDSCSKTPFFLCKEDNAKRYYRSGDLFIKLVRSTNMPYKEELEKEIEFVTNNMDISFINPVLDSGITLQRAYSIRKYEEGRLLFDIAQDRETSEWDPFFTNLLDKLIELENHGYYHGDLRSWNIICNFKKKEATIIDYGSMQTDASDITARIMSETNNFTVYDSFMSIVYDVITGKRYPYIKEYALYDPGLFYDLSVLESKYRVFFKLYYLDREKLNFAGIQQIFDKYVIHREKREFTLSEESYIKDYVVSRSHEAAEGRIDYIAERIKTNNTLRTIIRKQEEMQRSVEQEILQVKIQQNQLSESISKKWDDYQNQVYKISAENQKALQLIDELRAENRKLKDELSLIQNWVVLRIYKKIRG